MNYQNPYLNNVYPQYMQNPFNNNIFNQQMIPEISGKFVDSFENITANDVPMNGKAAIFPKNDLSEIQLRSWCADGTIKKTVYMPVKQVELEQTTNSASNEVNGLESAFTRVTEPLYERLDRIEELLKAKPRTRKDTANES